MGVIGMFLYSKDFRQCYAVDKRGEEGEEHELSKNCEGGSKSIETDAIMKIFEYAFCHCCL